MMRITYDADVDALYIRFLDGQVMTKHLDDGIALDYDAEGRLAGIELLDAQARFGTRDPFRQVVLENIALAG